MARINFGYVLRKLRHSRDETLEQVSEATGLSVAMLSRVERGERLPSPDSVEALARHFEIPVDYLMSETIANRMVNRYGEESSRSAAEHMSRVPEAGPPDAAEPASRSRQTPRSYGVFEEMDILAALGPERQHAPQAAGAQQNLVAAHEARLALETPGGASGEEPREDIDPATEGVLRAAKEASEAAAILVLREAPALSREARLELIGRITSLAGPAIDVLRVLASDADAGVRAAARKELDRLGRR